MAGALTLQEKHDRRALEKVVGRKILKKEFRLYAELLSERDLTVEDVSAEPTEAEYARLWFGLVEPRQNKKEK